MITTLASHYILAAPQAWDYLDASQMFLFSYSHQTRTSCFQFKKCGGTPCSLIHIAEPYSSSTLYPQRMYIRRKVHSFLLWKFHTFGKGINIHIDNSQG